VIAGYERPDFEGYFQPFKTQIGRKIKKIPLATTCRKTAISEWMAKNRFSAHDVVASGFLIFRPISVPEGRK